MGDYEASRIDKANHLLLDQPLLRLPYELLRKNFRSAHFAVEKDSAAVRNLLRETAQGALAGVGGESSDGGGDDAPSPGDAALRGVDAMVARLRGVKRKLAAAADDEARLYRQVDARLAHLAELADLRTLDDVRYEAWSRRRLDRLLVDYLLRRGYGASAAALAADKGIADLVDVDTFVAMGRVRDSLRAGSVTDALAWCGDNKKELRKMDSKLEFMLRYQQYIELVRTQSPARMMDAIAHAKKHLVPFRDVYPAEFGQAAGLLAFDAAHRPDNYSDLWSPARWRMLADLFTATHNRLLALPASPLLHMALSSGLSALKTPACHSAAQQQQQQQPAAAPGDAPSPAAALPPAAGGPGVCPICSPELNELARGVPYAHHSKSHVDHDLLILPGGRVYGQRRLDEHARKAGLAPGLVKDPRTGDVWPADVLSKVYIT